MLRPKTLESPWTLHYHSPDPFYQRIPLAPPSKYIQNLTILLTSPAASHPVQVSNISRLNSLPTGFPASAFAVCSHGSQRDSAKGSKSDPASLLLGALQRLPPHSKQKLKIQRWLKMATSLSQATSLTTTLAPLLSLFQLPWTQGCS